MSKVKVKDYSVPFSGWAVAIINYLNSKLQITNPRILYTIIILGLGAIILIPRSRKFFIYKLKKIVNVWKLSWVNKIIIVLVIIATIIVWNGNYITQYFKLNQLSNKLIKIDKNSHNLELGDLVDEYYSVYDKLRNDDEFKAYKGKKYNNVLVSAISRYHLYYEIWFSTKYYENRDLALDKMNSKKYNLTINLLRNNLDFIADAKFSVKQVEFKIRTYLDLSEVYRKISDLDKSYNYLNYANTLIQKITHEDEYFHFFNFLYHYALAKNKSEELNFKIAISEYNIANEFISEKKSEYLKYYFILNTDLIETFWRDNDFQSALRLSENIESEIIKEKDWTTKYRTFYNNILTRRAAIFNQIGKFDEADELIYQLLERIGPSKVERINFYSIILNYRLIEKYDNDYENLLNDLINEKAGLTALDEVFEVAQSYNALADLYLKRGDNEKDKYKKNNHYRIAEKYYYKSYEIREKHLLKTDPRYTVGLNDLGVIYQRQKKYIQAEDYFRKSLALRKQQNDQNFFYSQALFNLGFVLFYQEKLTEAVAYLEEAVILKENLLGFMNYNYIDAFIEWIYCLEKLDRKEMLNDEYLKLLNSLRMEGNNRYYQYLIDRYNIKFN